jgi:FkbM family methyltransferase
MLKSFRSLIHTLLKRFARTINTALSRAPACVAQTYIAALSLLSRNLLSISAAHHVHNSVCDSVEWPELNFGPRRVRLGRNTSVYLTPYFGECYEFALFAKHLDYEIDVFDWLERNAASAYDLVIEIGANVGMYTVFLDALIKRSACPRLQKIVSFEPSTEVFMRLLKNLGANRAKFVTAFHAAIGTTSGLESFFEPNGHLSNGSFLRGFAEMFSNSVRESTVAVLAASELERFLRDAEKALIKMDVEGFEPQLIDALGLLIARYHPDILIEILPGTPERLEACTALQGYAKFLIAGNGLQQSNTLFASETHRDWLLRSGMVEAK